MQRQEVTFQSLADTACVHIEYSDDDIVIIDSIQELVEVGAAHVSMSAIATCLKGKAQGRINGNDIALHSNQVAAIPPNTVITDLMVTPDFDIKAMFFTETILQNFLHDKINVWNELMYIHKLHVIDIDDEDMDFFNRFYQMMQFYIRRAVDTPYRTDVIQSLLRGGVLALCDAMRQRASTTQPVTSEGRHTSSSTYFQRFLHLLHSGNRQHRSVEAYASLLCVSPRYLTTLCKKHSGKTAYQWITEQQIDDIRYYLRETDLSIKQVCQLLGFPNTSFFGRYVKQHLGRTPRQYRHDK